MSDVIDIGEGKEEETELEAIARRNKENKERLKQERDKANKRVKRQYRLEK